MVHVLVSSAVRLPGEMRTKVYSDGVAYTKVQFGEAVDFGGYYETVDSKAAASRNNPPA